MSKFKALFVDESIIVSLLSLVLGLVGGAIVMSAGGYNPLLAYEAMFTKIVASSYDIGETLRTIVPLIITGLAVAVVFRAGLFNIGVEGQIVMGALGALMVGTCLSLPPVLHAVVAVVAGTLLGGLWGALVGILKTKRGINEVISSMMLNWTALYLSHMVINRYVLEKGTSRSQVIQESASIQMSGVSEMFGGARIHWGFVLTVIVLIGYHFYIDRTKWGYEIRAIGSNIHAAQYAGINVSQVVIRTFFLSGLLGGIVGTFEVLGVFKYMAIASTTSGLGFDGIAVALLGMNGAIGIVWAATMLGSLMYGAQGMSFSAGVPSEVIKMAIGIIIFFAAVPGIFRWLLIKSKRTKLANREG